MQYLGNVLPAFGQDFIWIWANFLTHLGKIFADLGKIRQVFWAILHF